MIELRHLPPDDAPEWRVRAFSHLSDVRARAEDRPEARVATPTADPGGEVWSIDGDQGWLWCVPVEGGVALGDLVVPEPARLPEVWRGITELAVERSWRRLTFSAFRGDPVSTILADQVESTLVATKMQLAVSDDVAASSDSVTLQPMDEERYHTFHQRSLDLYASELLESGSVEDPEEAVRASSQEMANLLPDGRATPGQLLFSAVDTAGETVGEVWIALQPHRAFLYDIMVDPTRRGQGLGTQMLRAAAAVTREHGRSVLALNVFGNNEGARRLYERSGFVTTESIHSVDLLASTTMPQGTDSRSGSHT